MTATSPTTDPSATATAGPTGSAGTAGSTGTSGPGDVAYYRLPHPLQDGALFFFDAESARGALDAARHGAPLSRRVYGDGGAPEAPDERAVRAVEARFRQTMRARARAAAGWSAFHWLLGPALALLWINVAPAIGALLSWLPTWLPIDTWIGSLGGTSGGPLLVVLVALAPLIWAWRRAWARAAEARRWGRLARVAGSRRLRDASLVAETSPAVAAFTAAAHVPQARLRAVAPTLVEKGADAAAEGAGLARTLYRLAARHGLGPVAGAYHAIFARLDAAEQRASRLERAGGGVLAERKVRGEMRRARQGALAALAPFSPAGRAPGNLLAPLLGALAGLAALAATLLVTGTYWVEPDQAVIVDPPSARLARLAGALGLGAAGSSLGNPDATEVVRDPGFNWGWPRPFAARHAITLGEQQLLVRAIFRRTGQDSFDGVAIAIQFRVADVQQWARIDRDGDGVDTVSVELSGIFQGVLQRARQDARQAVAQQNPALANDQQQLAAQADQLVESRLDELVQAFVGALGNSDAARQAGIQITNQYRWQMVHGIPPDVAQAALGGP